MTSGTPSAGRGGIARALAAASVAIAAASAGTAAVAADALNFRHQATFDVMAGNGSTVAEIVDASADGRQLVYTDSPSNAIGFVDVSAPGKPLGQGTLDVGGEPTSLVVRGDHVLVAVNTSESFANPSGKLVVVNRLTRAIVTELPLAGQPDSIALAPNKKRAAIVIENERDEDLNDGLLPQAPSGTLQILSMRDDVPANWTIFEADLSPVAAAAPDGGDLEPEYVDINAENEAVVTFQENNYIAIVDIRNGATINHFSAGSVVLNNVDSVEDDLITLDSTLEKRREPDSATWIDNDRFAVANEGDYEDGNGDQGGSRGFTIFDQQGSVVYESGAGFFEHLLVQLGHYNETRSENKGVEPEAIESAVFGDRTLLFVGSERSNAVGVYDVTFPGDPGAIQFLPTGIGPEGLKAIPKRSMLVASTETDEATVGIPTMINIYRLAAGEREYPMIQSGVDSGTGLPIPWVALSGLAADPVDAATLYAVSDAFLAKGYVYTIDVSTQPATITDRLEVTGASEALDLEGIAVGPDGSFWLGSEGAGPTGISNRVLKVNSATGAVEAEIGLPAGLVDQRRSNGIEGVAVTGDPGSEVVYVAIQRAWPNEGDTDGVNTKIGRYEVATGSWTFVHYPLEPVGGGDWIGLSELTLLPDGSFAVIERDKGWGPTTGFNAELKSLYRVKLPDRHFRAYDDPNGLVTVAKKPLRRLTKVLEQNSIWTPEKLEGFAMAADGRAYIVTDNDGVDGATGETVFVDLGTSIADKLQQLP